MSRSVTNRMSVRLVAEGLQQTMTIAATAVHDSSPRMRLRMRTTNLWLGILITRICDCQPLAKQTGHGVFPKVRSPYRRIVHRNHLSAFRARFLGRPVLREPRQNLCGQNVLDRYLQRPKSFYGWNHQ
jgi:hypothetical protein